jgi:hypothetical protein
MMNSHAHPLFVTGLQKVAELSLKVWVEKVGEWHGEKWRNNISKYLA